MNKEEIEEAKKHYIFTTEHELDNNNKRLKEYVEYLESILDKVTEYCKRFEYETEPIEDDGYLSERALVCEDILEIIEGEKE